LEGDALATTILGSVNLREAARRSIFFPIAGHSAMILIIRKQTGKKGFAHGRTDVCLPWVVGFAERFRARIFFLETALQGFENAQNTVE
jgi:hypothetical protein